MLKVVIESMNNLLFDNTLEKRGYGGDMVINLEDDSGVIRSYYARGQYYQPVIRQTAPRDFNDFKKI